MGVFLKSIFKKELYLLMKYGHKKTVPKLGTVLNLFKLNCL